MKIIDLSIDIENNTKNDPPPMPTKIKYTNHQESVKEMLSFFPGTTEEVLPNGLGWAVEDVTLTTHSGTHIDAPYHYHPTMNNGEKSWTIDEVPLEWFIGDGVVVDFSDKPNGYLVTSEDLKNAFEKINYSYKPGGIVLVHTNAADKLNTPAYLSSGCGMGKEATLWLVNQGMHVCGTDAWSWDRPLGLIAKEFQQTHDKNIIWEGHFAGIEKAYCHIEKLTNLDKLPPYGFKVICMPIKIKGASGAWIRAVAILED